MQHSASTKTWETTVAGEDADGFKNIFVRRGFPVYIIDAPRIGRAGWGCTEYTYTPDIGKDQNLVESWRLGTWTPPAPPTFFPNVQFPASNPDAVDQALRARYPEFEGAGNLQSDTDAVATLLDGSALRKGIGPVVLLTHSGSGPRGWVTRIKTENVKAIVAYEPASVMFPEGEAPARVPDAHGQLVDGGREIPLAEFMKLTQIPIQVVFGDNIPANPDKNAYWPDFWRIKLLFAKKFVETINAHGGDAELLHLPAIGIRGNTHFPMADLNNDKIADLLSAFLRKKGLDGYKKPSSRRPARGE